MGGPLLPRAAGGKGGPVYTQATLIITLAAGFATGMLSGYLYHQHHQLNLHVLHGLPGSHVEDKGVKTAHGYHLVRHDFSASTQATASSGSSSSSSSGSSSSSTSGGGESTRSGSSSSSTSGSSSSGSSTGAGLAGGERIFFKASIAFSNNNNTKLTPEEVKEMSRSLDEAAKKHPGDTIHALMTGNGSPYQNIQGRIMYQSLKMVMAQPGGEKITGFTRIMHRTTDDDLVVEFPTFRAYPLQPSCDTWCEFPVKDRANAVVQWLIAAAKDHSLIQGAWLLLLESDYVWHKPLMAPGSAHDPAVKGLQFHFDYMNPRYPGVDTFMKEMCPECDVEKIPASGPSPVLLRPRELGLIGPDWETYSYWIENNKEANEKLGWVREMYAWDVGVARQKVEFDTELPPQSRLMVQPPHDLEPGASCFYHYTWASIYQLEGKEVWRFEKREYVKKEDEMKIPTFKMPPEPWNPKWTLQDKVPVREGVHKMLVNQLRIMNEASAQLPDLNPIVAKMKAEQGTT